MAEGDAAAVFGINPFDGLVNAADAAGTALETVLEGNQIAVLGGVPVVDIGWAKIIARLGLAPAAVGLRRDKV